MYIPPNINIEELSRDPFVRGIKPWWIILIGSAILYLVPAQETLGLPFFGNLVNWLASLIPSVERWVELSPFPYHTKLFMVFVWVMVPVQIYWLIASIEIRRFCQAAYMAKSAKQKPIARIAVYLCYVTLFGGFTLLVFNLAIVDTPPCRVCVNTVKWAQLFIGCMTSLGISGLIAQGILATPCFIKSFTSKGA